MKKEGNKKVFQQSISCSLPPISMSQVLINHGPTSIYTPCDNVFPCVLGNLCEPYLVQSMESSHWKEARATTRERGRGLASRVVESQGQS